MMKQHHTRNVTILLNKYSRPLLVTKVNTIANIKQLLI